MPDLVPPLAELLSQRPGPYIALMLAGFAFGILGHLFKVKWLIATGVILIFLGALAFPLAANLSSDDRPEPIEESRTGDAG
ncbi:MAG TPA: hypothetical protein VHR18_01100 [Solirubrobacterales bacterium]|nr:hypothetical protein [Solirubrobacterales bacterium]